MSSSSESPTRYIVLDTNIIEYLGNQELATQIIAILNDAVSKNYRLSISAFTVLELIDTASVENEGKALGAIQGLKKHTINKSIIFAAGHLGCLYKDDGVNKEPDKGDKILGATAILHNAIIFTSNGRDFPQPFFKTISKPILKYTKLDGREVYIVFYFLEPDLEVIGVKHKERVKKPKRAKKAATK